MSYFNFAISLILFYTTMLFLILLYSLNKPMFPENAKWSVFIFLHKQKLNGVKSYIKNDEEKYFHMNVKNKDYIVSFSYDWMYHIYEGKTSEEIQFKYDLGGCSIKADYLILWEKLIGKNVCKYYVKHLKSE